MERDTSFKKYLPISEIDYKWGFIVNDVGNTLIKKGSKYSSAGHPGRYMFSWETGRILSEYHFVLITEGSGVFESKTAGTQNITAGDGFWLFPGEWHRYKPLKQTGWAEYWVGFSGEMPNLIMKNYFFKKKQPVVRKCMNMQVMSLLKTLFRLIREEPFGFQRLVSGVCLQLIAEIYNAQQSFGQINQRNPIISKAKYIMHNQIDGHVDFQVLAKNLGISYSKFRVDFKRQTGLAPLQYHLLLKIEKAKEMLINTELWSKQIAYNLGFESVHYFCRLFKQKTGVTPQQFRVQRLGVKKTKR